MALWGTPQALVGGMDHPWLDFLVAELEAVHP
jgi:hypothetical protein